MKNLTILLLSTFSLCASAQTKTSSTRSNNVKQTVTDDGKTLHITVKSNQAGKQFDYDRTFAVANMSDKQKDALVKRVNDSLGVNPPPAPPAPHLPVATSAKNSSSHSVSEEKTIKDDGKTMRIAVTTTKGGKEVSYDKSFLVKGLSKQQKEAMVKKITDSLGVSK